MSPLEFLEFHLAPGHYSLTYPLDLLASARHSSDQSDSHIFLKFDVRYLLIYFSIVHFFLQLILFEFYALSQM